MPARIAAPLVEMVEAAPGASPHELRKAPRQAEVLAWRMARGGPVRVEEILDAFPKARPQLRGLVQRKLESSSRRPAGPLQLEDAPWGSQRHDPTAAQSAALREIVAAQGYAPFLLHGVTASGETWVYLEAIAHFRAQGRGALALVPEIARTPQLAGRFRARFGDDVAALHSAPSQREALADGDPAAEGPAGVVAAARRAGGAPPQRRGPAGGGQGHQPPATA